MTDLPMLDSDPHRWVDEHAPLNEIEIQSGETLGRMIDVEDDLDSGVPDDQPAPRDPNGARLVEALRDYGLTVSVEWQAGRPGVRTGFVGCLGHHTAGRWRNAAGGVLLTPSLTVVKFGRPGLPGPLCNGYLGRDLVVRLITMGAANHPGEGGPLRLGDVTVARNDGRARLFGWEIEHDGVGEPWRDEMIEAAARCHAATVDVFGNGNPERHAEHSTWAPARKIDRRGYTVGRARAEIRSAQQSKGSTAAVPRVLRLTTPYTRGADVLRLQQDLAARGFDPGLPDGVFGPGTERAVRAFQTAHSLPADGIFGERTRQALATPDPDSWVIGAIRERWLQDRGLLGEALGPERTAPDGTGRFSEFEHGSIWWHPEVGAHAVRGSLRAAWWSMGGAAGVLGYPASSEAPAESWEDSGGIGAQPGEAVQMFQRGWLIWNPEHLGVRTVREVWRPLAE